MAAPADNSLEARILALENAVRAFQAGNLLDLASVVDASGNAVPLSSLAFGQVASIWPGIGVVSMTVAAGVVVDKTAPASAWTVPTNPGLTIDALVKGGRLRIDWAAVLGVAGAPGVDTFVNMSYALDYLGPEGAKGSVSQRVADPDYYRSIEQRDNSSTGNTGQFGSWYMHTGLTPGWYRATGAWLLGTPFATGSTAASTGSADNPRIAATPF